MNYSASTRCAWVPPGKPAYAHYHDTEWGVPSHNDRYLFEMLILEGAQAGLNWETILHKRSGYRDNFHEFDANKVAAMTDSDLEALRHNPGIVRNRLKIFAARRNAVVFLKIQQEFGSFAAYAWNFVGGTPYTGYWKTLSDVPTTTPQSDTLSKDLKKRGMTFVGSTIIYAWMQAVGLVNDHTAGCFLFPSTDHA
jgi:DNA-3-methyladenine glycosylase I